MKKLTFILVIISAQWALAQQIFYNPNDERFKSLYLEKVQSEYKLQKDEFTRQQELRKKGLISEKEFRESEARFKNAQLTYQQAILSLAFEQPHITIDKAIKYQAKDGKKRVKLTLRNTTGGLIAGRNIEIEDFEGIRTDQISNVYVSLLNDQNAIISQPYEAKIATMPYNQPIAVDFLLLQDLDNVIVKSVYGDKSEEKKIFLQKDESANRVLITSEQFSQEADLGTRANYDLTLELFSSMDNVYKLEALNLPRQISYDFLEAQTNARLSQVKFSQDINTRKLALAIYLPDRYDSTSFLIDQPISFFAAAIPPAQIESVNRERRYSANELDQMNVSYVRLELVPRGVGRIQVRATNFYQELKPGEKVQMNLTAYNDGTRRLDNIKVRADVPLNWVAFVVPDLIPSLLPGKEEIISVTITPPADVSVGDYEATIKTEAFASNRKVESEDKKIRIHIAASANIWGTAVLIFLLVGVLVGVVVFGVRLSRR
ncbi:MAG: NEW3 domain-containing protein [candidate division KSB1 bacterium]|nr:NEW3 domain-containing protein [candidate division KSB1 bacterium]MDZ7365225.1 NEW3 domain-containing protein [candidate division KSB1 bacterium]MDZ7407262.1 NEW3 domain-containing protein [candidate division KSB1 bacterium]